MLKILEQQRAFKNLPLRFVLLFCKLDLLGLELLAVDRTRIKVVNNKDRKFTRAVTIAGIELLHRIRKNQFDLSKLPKHAKTAPAIWNAVLTV